jgi:membrane-associated phospholipid phosphatase
VTRAASFAAILALATVTATARDAMAQPRPRWIGATRVDAEVRHLLRAREPGVRSFADGASWAIVGFVMAAPVGLATGAALARGAPAASVGESLLSLALPYGVTALVGFGGKFLFARERPFATAEGLSIRCARGDEPGCDPERNASFPSLHAGLGFAGATMTCVHALRFGRDAALDGLACGAATFGASVGAALRIVADRHYATDVLVGSLLGAVIAAGLGVGLHHGEGAPWPLARALDTPTPLPLPIVLGGLAGALAGPLAVAALSPQWR